MNNRFEAKFILGCDPIKDNILITNLVTAIVSKLHRTPDIYANMYKIVVEKDNNIVFESFPSIEENNDKPGIHGTTFKAIFDKEDLTPYFDTKLIEELYDYSRNFVKAKTEELFKLKVRYNEALLENQKEKDNHARGMKLFSYKDYKAEVDYKTKQEQGNNLEEDKLFNKTIEEAEDEHIIKAMNQIEKEIWFDMRDKEVNQHDINYPLTKDPYDLYREEMAKVQKLKEEDNEV